MELGLGVSCWVVAVGDIQFERSIAVVQLDAFEEESAIAFVG
jgi:hypothetical protein